MKTYRLLQGATAMLALIPLTTGVLTMMGVDDPLYRALGLPPHPLLDSNMRFLGGVWLGLGLSVLWLVPRLASQAVLFRALWAMIFIGGLGRLISMSQVGLPPVPFIVVTALELLGAPLFVGWLHLCKRTPAASHA